MIFKISKKLFLKNIVSNIILFLQITISVILVNIMIGSLNFINVTEYLFHRVNGERTIYYMPINPSEETDYLLNYDGVESIGKIEQYLVYNNNNEIPLFGYDNELISFIHPDEMFEVEEDYVSVLISEEVSEYKTGSIFEFETHDGKTIPIKIVGLIKKPTYVLNFSTASNALKPNDLFRYYDFRSTGYPIFVTTQEQIEKFSSKGVTTQFCSMIYLSSSISDTNYHKLTQELKKNGDYIDGNQIIENGNQQKHDTIKFYAPYLFCGFFISIIGFLGLIILNIIKSLSTISILHISGCAWKKCSFICLLASVYVMLLSILFLILSFTVSNSIFPLASNGIIIKENNILITMLFYIIYIICSIIIPKLYLFLHTPIQIYRNLKHQ